MTSWVKRSPPEGYDKGLHLAYLEKLDHIEKTVLPSFIIGARHLENCRKINLGIISDGQAMPAIDGTNDPFIPGAANVFAWGVPGVGKTLIGKVFSGVYGIPFKRIQLTADLLPADIIGSRVFDQETGRYKTVYGPAALGRFILADELSRATEKTQSALLELMESWSITIASETFRINPAEELYFVFATGNPVETRGVFQLSEALLDRFGQFLLFEYLDDQQEMMNLLEISEKYAEPQNAIKPVMTEQELISLRAFRRKFTRFSNPAKDYITRVMLMMRNPENEKAYLDNLRGYIAEESGQVIALGGSDRAMEAFFGHLAKAHAFRRGAWEAEPEDAKAVAVDCLSHRLMLTSQGESFRKTNYPFLRKFEFQQHILRAILGWVEIYAGKDKGRG